MRLTQYTDYALRVLIYAGLNSDRAVQIGEISRSFGISRNHLTKVVPRLAAGGYVHTARGKGGGIRLALPPQQIRLGEVVRHTEGDGKLVECFDLKTNRCRIVPVCLLGTVLGEALESFLAALDCYTLADILESPGSLAALLLIENGIAPGAAAAGR